jgi:hypothetical protein
MQEGEKIDFGLTEKLDAYWLQRFHAVYRPVEGIQYTISP